jgi:hypothetical protein
MILSLRGGHMLDFQDDFIVNILQFQTASGISRYLCDISVLFHRLSEIYIKIYIMIDLVSFYVLYKIAWVTVASDDWYAAN